MRTVCPRLCPCRFDAGDVLMIRPQNSPEDVQQLCELLKLDPERQFILRPTDGAAGWGRFILSQAA